VRGVVDWFVECLNRAPADALPSAAAGWVDVALSLLRLRAAACVENAVRRSAACVGVVVVATAAARRRRHRPVPRVDAPGAGHDWARVAAAATHTLSDVVRMHNNVVTPAWNDRALRNILR
jgi:hypothetical protein